MAAGIWRIDGKSVKVLSSSLPVAWEETDEVVNASDAVLSAVVQGMPDDIDEISKTVFGVSSGWVQGGEIREEHLAIIKEVCTKLSLMPIGFVVIPEAVSHYVKANEGTPVSAVAIGVYKESVEVSVFITGKLVGTTQVTRSVNLDEDVIEGISRFANKDPIPTRFILYNSKEGELEDARQSLIKVNWEDFSELKILHTPKIEIVTPDEKVSAICFAGASEIAQVENVEKVESTGVVPEVPDLPDIEEESVNLVESSEQEVGGSDKLSAEDSVGELSGEEPVRVEGEPNIVPASLASRVEPELPVDNKRITSRPSLSNYFRDFHIPFAGKPLGFGLLALVGVFVLGFILWWFVPKAVVTVYVSPQRLDEKVEVSFSEDISQADLMSGRLPVEKKVIEVVGEKTKETTGVKTVGDKATGEVTLYRVGPTLSVKAGTVLLGPENLKFVLDESASVASGSAGSPGTTKVKVSADSIGAQYNLAQGTNFVVGNFSNIDIEAKNETAFSGGSSRQIASVAAKDASALSEELKSELLDKAIGEFLETLSDEQLLIKESSSLVIKSEEFSHKVGDEASTLKLGLALNVGLFVVNENELLEFISRSVASKVPDGYTMPASQMEYQFSLNEKGEDSNKYTVGVIANLIPKVDNVELSKKIRGKYISTANEILEREVPGFSGLEVRMRPGLPGRLKTLPHVLKNITFELSARK